MVTVFKVLTLSLLILSEKKENNLISLSCKKGYRIYLKLYDEYLADRYIYPAKRVRTTYDQQGNPIYDIRKRNKDIVFLGKLTNILCKQNEAGTYFVSIEDLTKWKSWFAENCPSLYINDVK